jgi:hypothetical protein
MGLNEIAEMRKRDGAWEFYDEVFQPAIMKFFLNEPDNDFDTVDARTALLRALGAAGKSLANACFEQLSNEQAEIALLLSRSHYPKVLLRAYMISNNIELSQRDQRVLGLLNAK